MKFCNNFVVSLNNQLCLVIVNQDALDITNLSIMKVKEHVHRFCLSQCGFESHYGTLGMLLQ